MSKNNSKRYPIAFGKLHHLTPFSLSGVGYRKIGETTAVRINDGKTSVFYPNERVILEGQPPHAQPLVNLNDDATVTAYNVAELREAGLHPMTEVTIITWGSK